MWREAAPVADEHQLFVVLAFETKSVRLCSPVAFWGLVYKHHQHELCLWEVLVVAQTHAKSDGEDCRKVPLLLMVTSKLSWRASTSNRKTFVVQSSSASTGRADAQVKEVQSARRSAQRADRSSVSVCSTEDREDDSQR